MFDLMEDDLTMKLQPTDIQLGMLASKFGKEQLV